MNSSEYSTLASMHVKALFLAERIDIRALETATPVAEMPLMIETGEKGRVVLFRFGVVVLFDLQPLEEVSFLNQIEPFCSGVFAQQEDEETDIVVQADKEERVGPAGVITLRDLAPERLQLVAIVLSKSVVLAHYEMNIAKIFDQIEPMANDLRERSRIGSNAKELIAHIGDVLQIEHRMVGRVEVNDKPELLWENPALERVYKRLVDEYELHERNRALHEKLELISKTVERVIDLLQHRRSLRVEWYIVILIVIEIILYLYEMFWPQNISL